MVVVIGVMLTLVLGGAGICGECCWVYLLHVERGLPISNSPCRRALRPQVSVHVRQWLIEYLPAIKTSLSRSRCAPGWSYGGLCSAAESRQHMGFREVGFCRMTCSPVGASRRQSSERHGITPSFDAGTDGRPRHPRESCSRTIRHRASCASCETVRKNLSGDMRLIWPAKLV